MHSTKCTGHKHSRIVQMMDCDNIMNEWQKCLEKLNLGNELGRNAASKEHEGNYTHKG